MQDVVDYIVVGAGSAGCVVANRLSQNGQNTVCLLEAGPVDKSPLIHIPFGIIGLIREGRHNWGYNTQPEPELDNRRLYWPRGKTLGGSSSINAMVYIRGNPEDYNDWEKAGNPGWSWKDLLPIFKTLEGNERGSNEYHGNLGELNVADIRSANPLSNVFIEAGKECGIPTNEDFNGDSQNGVGFYQVTQKNGMRFSSAKAFLTKAKFRSNIKIYTETHATRIIFNGQKAVGIEVRNSSGEKHTIYANKEIVLSGGAINTPQLLMLSGVGPKNELEKHGISVIHNLPGVGKNLQDHLDVTVMINETSYHSIGISWSAIPRTLIDIFRFLFQRKGFLSSNVSQVGGFVSLPDDPINRPGIQFHFLPTFLRDHGRQLTLGHGCTIHACQLRPKSRGEITLNSADPMDHPRIQPNYLTHPDDMRDLVHAVKWARKLFGTNAFAKINGGEVMPGKSVVTDEDIIRDIRQRAETIYHPVGTCRMGADELAVVDSNLKVRGIEGLRIADASIMPTIVSGNTNAPCMVIGEKCSRMILENNTFKKTYGSTTNVETLSEATL